MSALPPLPAAAGAGAAASAGAAAVPPPPPPPPPAPAAAPATAAAASTTTPVRTIQDVRQQVESVQQVMAANVNAVLDRGERLDTLESKTDGLYGSAAAFSRQGAALRRKMWWQNVRAKLCVGLSIGLVLVVLFALACYTGGRSCFGGGKEEQAAPGVLVGNDSALNDAAAGMAAVLPDGTAVAVPVAPPLPFAAPPAPPGVRAVDAPPGELTTEEAAAVLSGIGRRRRR
jgi:hypothetical protein